jgi:tetraacyldisaccharide 4'-kinase
VSLLQRAWYPPSRKPEAPLWTAPLQPLAWGFGGVVAAKNALFEAGWRTQTRIEGVRIISVGNLTVGGAGKTPAVIHLVHRAQALGLKVAVLSRGYGRLATDEVGFDAASKKSALEVGDEPLLIARRCPGVTVWVGADRVSTARRAKQAGARLLILDDGFQHRRLARDADVVAVNEARGFGNGRLLPRGPLREPLSALSRACLIWVQVGRAVGPPLPAFEAKVVRARNVPFELVEADGRGARVQALQGRRVFAFSALADPEAFPKTLLELGAEVTGSRAYGDHHLYTADELGALAAQARKLDAALITTEKDAMRLPEGFCAHVRLEVELLEGAEHLDALLAPSARIG